ncbi:hypothetical protein EOD39_16458 [Acipenser ruthenus]|uniref:TRIM8/14/16/25/29/45/65 coiled-coil region domain-containing protein n=1 Tax=Acipenser ruthenus TaxID=7906 RepID=A0A444V5W9_ACIRT|nr:hypothetical protein EOD39_16458 [Acipenser ruthenus]
MSPLLCSFTQRSACIEIKESEKIFTELIRSIEKIHTEVIELIGANKKAAVNQAEGLMKKLEQEIAELRRRNAELKQLSETEDHIHFLQVIFYTDFRIHELDQKQNQRDVNPAASSSQQPVPLRSPFSSAPAALVCSPLLWGAGKRKQGKVFVKEGAWI